MRMRRKLELPFYREVQILSALFESASEKLESNSTATGKVVIPKPRVFSSGARDLLAQDCMFSHPRRRPAKAVKRSPARTVLRLHHGGMTGDLQHRVGQHKHKTNSGFTSRYKLAHLAYSDRFFDSMPR